MNNRPPYLPSKDIEPSELVRKLLEYPRPSSVIDFPRLDHITGKPIAQVRIQVLGVEAHDAARIAAHNKIKAKGYSLADLESPALREVTGDAVAKELLARAVVSVEPIPGSDEDRPSYARLFRDADEVHAVLTADELAVLFAAYVQTQYQFGPYDRFFTSGADVDAWIQRIKAGASEHHFLSLTSQAAADLHNSLVDRISTLYDILASHWSTLPQSLRSDLETFSTVITSFGEPPANIEQTSRERAELSLAEATRLAQQIKG